MKRRTRRYPLDLLLGKGLTLEDQHGWNYHLPARIPERWE
jgi:hypothetical protein